MKYLFFLFFAILQGFNVVSAQHILHSEVLGRPTKSGITIELITDSIVEGKVLYGTQSSVYSDSLPWQTFQADASGEAVCLLKLQNLSPDQKYYYRVKLRKPGSAKYLLQPEHTFHTARNAGSPFVFTIEADPHLDASSDTALFRRCLRNQLEDQPDFMIDMGDFLMTDKLKNSGNFVPKDTIPYRCKLLRSYYESACHSVPLYIVLGNHEGEAGWYLNNSPENIAVWNTIFRKKYFTNPSPDDFYSGDGTQYDYVGQREAWYSWTWGDALFIVLDPYWLTTPKPDNLHGWRWTLGKAQYEWLKSTLETSTASFKFVFCHQLVGGDAEGRGGIEKANLYEWGGENADGTDGWTDNRPGWYKPIKALLEENEVNIFFHGHDHLYANQDLNCLVYQEIPQPSLPNFQGVPQATDYGYVNGTIIPNSGHLRVSVSPENVKVEYVRVYLPPQENASRHNKDIAATYVLGKVNCYDSLGYSLPENRNGKEGRLSIYPNPGIGEVTISYHMAPGNENCMVQITDIQGKLVKIPEVNAVAGNEEEVAVWDGTNLAGIRVESGIYLCRLTTRNSVLFGKIILRNE